MQQPTLYAISMALGLVRFSNQDWDGPRHWLQRAWTLQEIADENATINGGIPRDEDQIFLNSSGEVLGTDQVRKVTY